MDKKISEFNEATQISDNDLLAIVQQGETKKIKAKLLCDCGGSSISIIDVRPGIYAGEVILIDQNIPNNLPEFKNNITSEEKKFPFKRNSIVGVYAHVTVYLSDVNRYFTLTLQIFDEDYNLIYNESVQSQNGNGVETPFNLEIPVFALALDKKIYYIKTELSNEEVLWP